MFTGSTLTNGAFELVFTNTPGASFTILTATNVNAPLTNWTVLTNVVENPPGHFQFIDSQATHNHRRFYRMRSP